jgi:hypothetical protein
MHSGALKEPPQHNSTNRCRGTPPKARVFLGSIEGAKSAPARPSAGFSRRPAAAADGGDCAITAVGSAEEGQLAAFVSLCDRGTEAHAHDAMGGSHHPQPAAESSHEEGLRDVSPAAAFVNDSATAGQCVPTARVYTAAGRSKAAVPLTQYIRASDGTSASSGVQCDAASPLVYSSHLRPGTCGRGLVDGADESDAQVKQRKTTSKAMIARLFDTMRSGEVRASLLLPLTPALPFFAWPTCSGQQRRSNLNRRLFAPLHRL